VPPDGEPLVVRVVCDVAAIGKAFDYTVPPGLAGRVERGTEVRVVLHGRRVRGWVDDIGVAPPPGVELRPLSAVRGVGPPPAVMDLAPWAAWRWAGRTPTFLRTASSGTVVRALPRPVHGAGLATAPPPAYPGVPAGASGWIGPDALADAVAGGTAVVRLPPAADTDAVVLAAVRAAGDAGTLVLAPGQREAAAVAGRLRRRGHRVALLPGQWAEARAGGVVAVGSRAAAFAPLPALGAAVVLDAHDEVYQEERAPTWNAWQVVAERARRDGAPVALVSACPTLDLLAAGRLITSSRAAERAGWPALEVVDRRGDDPRTGLYSERLVALVRWAAGTPGRRLVCVLNRTGRARLLACAACGELARCERCLGPLELVTGEGAGDRPGGEELRCRRCGSARPVVCARCGATRLRSLRVGVTRVREELEAIARVPVVEVAGPARAAGPAHAPHRGSGSPARGRGEEGAPVDAAVVVGTEAALHRVPAADAVAFVDFDAELLAPRLRAGEEALALLARAARLTAGTATAEPPSRARGRVLVQTRQPQHEVLDAALHADPGRLAAAEGATRRALSLPPYGALAVVSGPAAAAYGEALAAAAPPEVGVHPVGDGSWAVRGPGPEAVCDLLASVARPPGRVRVAMDPLRA